MANEITLTIKAALANGNLSDVWQPTPQRFDQGAKLLFRRTLLITTAAAPIVLSGITTPGFVMFQNLDATNYVQWGFWTGSVLNVVGRIKPTEPCGPWRLDVSALAVLGFKANTASCLVDARCYGDA